MGMKVISLLVLCQMCLWLVCKRIKLNSAPWVLLSILCLLFKLVVLIVCNYTNISGESVTIVPNFIIILLVLSRLYMLFKDLDMMTPVHEIMYDSRFELVSILLSSLAVVV